MNQHNNALTRAIGWRAVCDGSALVAGSFEGAATFGSTTLTSAGWEDTYIAKLNADGSYAWVTQVQGADYNSVTATALSVLSDDSVLVAGAFEGTAIFGSITLTSDNQDIFITKLNPDGTWDAPSTE